MKGWYGKWICGAAVVFSLLLFLVGCLPTNNDVTQLEDTGTTAAETMGIPVTTLGPFGQQPEETTAPETRPDHETTQMLPEQTHDTEPENETGVIVTVPEEMGGTGLSFQQRLYSMKDGWWSSFDNGNDNYVFVAETAGGLTQGLKERNIPVEDLDLEGFDEVFFQSNRLAVIPRATNTGSVRYSYDFTPTVDGVEITLYGKAPTIVTADMADWLLLVPVSLEEYGSDTVITVNPAGASFASNTVDK